MYTLQSKEGELVMVSKSVVEMSQFLQAACEQHDQDDTIVIPLPNVSTATLNQVVELCNHHQIDEFPHISKPLPQEDDMIELFGEWYDAFFHKITKEELFDIVMAANYLDIQPLLKLCCARVAAKMRGKSTEQIKDFLDL